VVGRRLYVTEFGIEIAEVAQNIIDQVETISKPWPIRQLTGRLKVSIVSTGKYVMPYFLADFMKVNSE
jgi:DNA-binding transcriptional LysR family regulator